MDANAVKELLKTQTQRDRETRNIEIIKLFKETVAANPTEKKTRIISMCAEKFNLTYSATRLILIKVGVYKSKQ